MFIAGGTDGIGLALLRRVAELRELHCALPSPSLPTSSPSTLPSTIYVLGRDFRRINDDEALATSLRRGGTSLVRLVADVCDSGAVTSALTRVDVREQPLTHVVNTIGTFVRKRPIGSPRTTDEAAELERSLSVNVVGNIALTRALLPLMMLPDAVCDGDGGGDGGNGDDGGGGALGAQAAATAAAAVPSMVVLSATLADDPRAGYSTQSCTKAAFAAYIKALQAEHPRRLRTTLLYVPSLATGVFRKAGDDRDISKYPPPSSITDTILHILNLPACLAVRTLTVAAR